MSRLLVTNKSFELLEPYEGKLSCTVLRGEGGSNALDLPDENMLYLRWAVLNVGWCVVLVRRIIIWDMMIIAWE